jgi:hypothetical protein
MRGPRLVPTWRFVFWFFLAGWAVTYVGIAITGRVLFADSAHGLLTLLQKQHLFFEYDTQRRFASFLIQLPVLVAERLYIRNISIYAALYSIGLNLLPPMAWLTALYLSRARPVLFVGSAAVATIFGFGANFIDTESNLQIPLCWLCAVIISLERPAPLLRGFVLPILAFGLLYIYEGMLLAGPVLAAWAVYASGRVAAPREQVGLQLSALLFVLATIVGVISLVAPRDLANANGFSLAKWLYVRNPQALLMVGGLFAVAAIFVRNRILAWIFAAVVLATSVLYLWKMLHITGFIGYRMYYENRAFLVLAFPAFLVGFFVLHHLEGWWMQRLAAERAAVLLVPFAFALLVDLHVTRDWLFFTQQFCIVLKKPMTPAERLAALKATGAHTAWDWSLPSLSTLLRDNGSDAVVMNEPGQPWEPQDQYVPIVGFSGLCQTSPLLRGITADTPSAR